MVIDAHVHLTKEKIAESFIPDPDEMIAKMDALGIDMAILMSISEHGMSSADEMREVAESNPERFRYMCNIDISSTQDDIYKRLSEWKLLKAVGIGELIINRRMDDMVLSKVFESAERLQLPITLHISPREGYNYGVVDDPGLPLLEKTLSKYPDLVILGHSQCFWIEISGDAPSDDEGRNSWRKGPVVRPGRLEKLFDEHQNLYGDLSANSGSCAIMRDEEYGLYFLRKYQDRLIFATDTSDTTTVFPLKGYLEKKRAEGLLDDEILEKIFHLNAERIFNL